MLVRPLGSVIWVMPVQPVNVLPEMTVTVEGMSICVKPVLRRDATPIAVRPSGRLIWVRLLQPSKAKSLMVVTPLLTITFLMLVRLLYQGVFSDVYVVIGPVPEITRMPLLVSV